MPPHRSLLPYQWELIALFWLAYFFNQADRMIYNVVLPALSKDLGLSDVQGGLVATVFMLTYAVLVPVAGYAGDVFRRKWIVFGSLLVWSAALIGVLVADKLSDTWAPRRRTLRMECECLGLFLGAPFVALKGLTDNLLLCYVGLAGFGLCRGIYDSNLFAALFDVIEPRHRASAVGAMLAVCFAISSLGPTTLGWAKATIGLTSGIAALSLIFVASAVVVLVATKKWFAQDYYCETAA